MRVFISSVMRGFAEERAAVRSAVEELGMQPIMAERFPAQAATPQEACREGVRQGDVYVGVLGDRYGFVAASGKSVTEEEYDEARRLNKPVLWFVTKSDSREAEAKEFLKRISRYEDGLFIKSFSRVEELKSQVMAALHQLATRPRSGRIRSQADAVDRIDGLVDEVSRNWHEPMIAVGVVPVAVTEIDLLHLEQRASTDQLKQRALFGSTAWLVPEDGVCVQAEQAALKIQPGRTDHRSMRLVRLYSDGAVVAGSSVENQDDDPMNMAASWVIEQSVVAERLEAFLAYAGAYYGEIVKAAGVRQVFVHARLIRVGDRLFGQARGGSHSSFSMPFGSPDKTIVVPEHPVQVAVDGLAAPSDLAADLTRRFERAFRVAGRRFGPPR